MRLEILPVDVVARRGTQSLMANPLIETKLHVPPPRRNLVPRQRLLARLDDAADARLILVAAPAGFGKTTLVAEWLGTVAERGSTVAWLSLDERDNDPVLFWSYVLAAMQQAAPDLGAGARTLLDSGGVATDIVLATLVNELHGVDHDVVLVLDDFHVIERSDIHDGLAYLVDHLPETTQLVITSRADPPLPLARLRAKGELGEVRAADLRFTAEEAADYLNGAMGLALAAADVATLEARTEGWIAALQLAALSMQGRDDVAQFIAGFAGDDRFIVDYLAGEVLHRQPDAVRQFLLQTSVLDRMTGPLCDAVTGTTGGTAMLGSLDRQNLFVIPLDDRREWYRYHHLFADVLRARLLDEDPDAAGELHRRASAWYEDHGRPADAIRHAATAGDVTRAAALAELAMPAVRRDRHDATLREWTVLIPEDVVRVRPVLALGFVGVLMTAGELGRVDATLREVEEWLALAPEARAASGMVVVDDEQLRALPGAIEMYRAALALMHGDIDGTVAHARRVLAVAPADDELGRAAAHALLGLSAWSEGDLDRAFAEYTESIAGMRRIGHSADILGCSISMADIRVAQGRLRDAQRCSWLPTTATVRCEARPTCTSASPRSCASVTTGRLRPSTSDRPRPSRRSGRGSTPTGRGRCAPACCWPTATRPAASRSWRRPSGATTPTSPPPCVRLAHAGRVRTSSRATSARRARGCVSAGCRPTTSWPTSWSSSTSRWRSSSSTTGLPSARFAR